MRLINATSFNPPVIIIEFKGSGAWLQRFNARILTSGNFSPRRRVEAR
jgi:hypothetical protein